MISSENQWDGFYMIGTSVIVEWLRQIIKNLTEMVSISIQASQRKQSVMRGRRVIYLNFNVD